jgi:hypothetical protein
MSKLTIFAILHASVVALSSSGAHLQPRAPQVVAKDFCAVTLHVTGARGEPITSTWIELVNPTGRVVRREMTNGSEHKICDFGFGPHTLRVGTNECLPVAISDLRVVFGHPLTLNVILYGSGYCERMRSGCFIYFRTVDENHDPLPAVSLSPTLDIHGPSETDAFGRYQSLFHGSYDVSFTKRGFTPAKAHIQCKSDEEIDVEVLMRKAGEHDR